MSNQSIYTTDHAPSVLATHSWRNLSNSAAYIIPHLERGQKILDIGCGPGSLTVDIAKRIQPGGAIIGIENTPDVLSTARALAEQNKVNNATFEVGDAYALAFDDDSFDVVHVHQVLQHLADPVKALQEMRRVVKPGGLVACRESAVPTWYPENKGLQKATDLYVNMAKARGTQPHSGRMIHAWAVEAGFPRESIQCTTGSWCFASDEERHYWGGSNRDRAKDSGLAKQAVEGHFATREDLDEIVQSWEAFVQDKMAWYSILHGEILCRK